MLAEIKCPRMPAKTNALDMNVSRVFTTPAPEQYIITRSLHVSISLDRMLNYSNNSRALDTFIIMNFLFWAIPTYKFFNAN